MQLKRDVRYPIEKKEVAAKRSMFLPPPYCARCCESDLWETASDAPLGSRTDCSQNCVNGSIHQASVPVRHAVSGTEVLAGLADRGSLVAVQ